MPFSNAYTPNGFQIISGNVNTIDQQIPVASDWEAIMCYMNNEATSHGWDDFTWQRHNGQKLEEFQPTGTFGTGAFPNGGKFTGDKSLLGYPFCSVPEWKQIRDAWGTIGDRFFLDYRKWCPFPYDAYDGQGSLWSPTLYPQYYKWAPIDPMNFTEQTSPAYLPNQQYPYGWFGKIDHIHALYLNTTYYPFNSNSFPLGNPIYFSKFLSYTAPTGPPCTFNTLGGNNVPPSCYNNVTTAQMKSAAQIAWKQFQDMPFSVAQSSRSNSCSTNALYTITPQNVGCSGELCTYDMCPTIKYGLQFAVWVYWLGEWNVKSYLGMLPLSDGTLPAGGVTSIYKGGYSDVGNWNPWNDTAQIVYGNMDGSLANLIGQQTDTPAGMPYTSTVAINNLANWMQQNLFSELPGSTFYQTPGNWDGQPINWTQDATPIHMQNGKIGFMAVIPASIKQWMSGNMPTFPTSWPTTPTSSTQILNNFGASFSGSQFAGSKSFYNVGPLLISSNSQPWTPNLSGFIPFATWI